MAHLLKLYAEKEHIRMDKIQDIELRIGDTVAFGRLNGKEYGEAEGRAIRWRVVDTQDNKAFLVAEQYVGRQPYRSDVSNVGVTGAGAWGTFNELRRWLNKDFRKRSFDSKDHMRLERDENNDYITLLTAEEAKRYFETDVDRRLQYAYESDMKNLDKLKSEYQGLEEGGKLFDRMRTAKRKKELENWISNWHEWSGWWLRPTGYQIADKYVPYVAGDGSIRTEGLYTAEDGSLKRGGMYASRQLYVRPAMWIITKA